MTRTRLNDRDKFLLEIIKEFGIITSKTASIYFEGKNKEICASRRLLKLYNNNPKLNRYRENILSEYVYYFGKKKGNYKHNLTRLEVFTALKLNPNIEIIKYKLEKEYVVDNKKVRCDLSLIVRNITTKEIIPVLVEIDLTHRYNNKYKHLDYNSYFGGTKPIVISVGRFTPLDDTNEVLFYKVDEIKQLKDLFSTVEVTCD